ncbi:MAG: hypothetical protein Q7U10_07945 [Thermodesulfovibrionia bacterium]|nr:hypothetical protein [Thermodesulfovibrionia bacterium]
MAADYKKALKYFIDDKVSIYKEPQRKNTPKGDPIGFSLNKYKASLHMLRGISQKKISEEIGISYGLLRKWNTEEDFKKLLIEHFNEFNRYYVLWKQRQSRHPSILKIRRDIENNMDVLFSREWNMRKRLNDNFISLAIELLQKQTLTDEDKKLAIRYLYEAIAK